MSLPRQPLVDVVGTSTAVEDDVLSLHDNHVTTVTGKDNIATVRVDGVPT